MRPRKVVKRRKPSKPARHTEAAPFACVGNLCLSIEPNPMNSVPGHQLVVTRCDGCGRIIDVRGVMPEPELVQNNDDDDDCA